MKFRMNGHTFRSASDIAQIIASIPTDHPSHVEIDHRIELMSSRFENRLDLWTGEPLTENDVSADETIFVDMEDGEID